MFVLRKSDLMCVDELAQLSQCVVIKLYSALYKKEKVKCPFCKKGLVAISGRTGIFDDEQKHIGNTYRFVCNRKDCGKEFFGDHVWEDKKIGGCDG